MLECHNFQCRDIYPLYRLLVVFHPIVDRYQNGGVIRTPEVILGNGLNSISSFVVGTSNERHCNIMRWCSHYSVGEIMTRDIREPWEHVDECESLDK